MVGTSLRVRSKTQMFVFHTTSGLVPVEILLKKKSFSSIIVRLQREAMRETPNISEAEWKVMKVIWEKFPVSAAEIIDLIAKRENWHPKTVKTLLTRLVKKGALSFEKDGRAYLYRPMVSESECVKSESESFLQRVFGGSLQPMLSFFVENKKLSPSELEELKSLLNKKKR
jgi:BlaI family penicillinase repressor